jgi:hypothetical protein
MQELYFLDNKGLQRFLLMNFRMYNCNTLKDILSLIKEKRELEDFFYIVVDYYRISKI